MQSRLPLPGYDSFQQPPLGCNNKRCKKSVSDSCDKTGKGRTPSTMTKSKSRKAKNASRRGKNPNVQRAGKEAEAEKFFLRRCACLENKALSKGWFSRGTSCSDFEGQLLSWGYSCVCSPGAAITIQVNYCAIVAWIGRADVPALLARKSRRTHRRSSTRRSSNRNRPKSFFFSAVGFQFSFF